MAPEGVEELRDPKDPYPGHIEELKTIRDILTKITQKNAQKDKALKHLEGVIRRLQEEEKEPKPKDKEVLEKLAAIESHLCELKAPIPENIHVGGCHPPLRTCNCQAGIGT